MAAGMIFNDDPVVTGERRAHAVSLGGLVAGFIIMLIIGYFAAPYLPYPHRYCAKHPHNHNCIGYRPSQKGTTP